MSECICSFLASVRQSLLGLWNSMEGPSRGLPSLLPAGLSDLYMPVGTGGSPRRSAWFVRLLLVNRSFVLSVLSALAVPRIPHVGLVRPSWVFTHSRRLLSSPRDCPRTTCYLARIAEVRSECPWIEANARMKTAVMGSPRTGRF